LLRSHSREAIAVCLTKCTGQSPMPFRFRTPRGSNSIPDPATRSRTVPETSTSPSPASPAIREPITTARPDSFASTTSHSPVCTPMRTPSPRSVMASRIAHGDDPPLVPLAVASGLQRVAAGVTEACVVRVLAATARANDHALSVERASTDFPVLARSGGVSSERRPPGLLRHKHGRRRRSHRSLLPRRARPRRSGSTQSPAQE
jgi:hypothetical protein